MIIFYAGFDFGKNFIDFFTSVILVVVLVRLISPLPKRVQKRSGHVNKNVSIDAIKVGNVLHFYMFGVLFLQPYTRRSPPDSLGLSY